MPEIPVTSLPIRLQRQVDQARTALDRGNTEYAINICRDVLRQHPGCLPVRRLLRAAQLKIFKGRNRFVAKALGGLTSAPALMSAQAQVRKDPGKAMEAAERALGSDPTNLAALRLLAQAASALELPETAVFALETVREKQPTNRGVLVQLADAYIAAGRAGEALAIAERLLREAPGEMEMQDLLKRASVAQSITAGRWDSGSGTYRDKLRDEDTAVALEQASRVVSDADSAQQLLDDSVARIAAEPAHLTHYRSAINACRHLGRFDDALTWVARARALPTGMADVTLEKLESDLRLARIEHQIRERETAPAGAAAPDAVALGRLREELAQQRVAELRHFAEKYPNDASYKYELGQHYHATGQLDLAIQQFQMAQRHPKLRLGALMQLGACFQAKGQFDLAAQQFETAKNEIVAFDDQKKEAIYQLGLCFEAMGRAERALEEFKQIYSWDIGFRDVAAKIDRSYAKE